MTLPKALALLIAILFMTIGVAALFKNRSKTESFATIPTQVPLEIELDQEIQEVVPAVIVSSASDRTMIAQSAPVLISEPVLPVPLSKRDVLPEADRVEEFFNKGEPKLPIVETITYKSHVDWQKGRPAWLSDYAGHYCTSRHFIARSLNGKPDYFKQEIADGDRFNVFRQDKPFRFHLVVDTSRCKMWLYYLTLDDKQKTLVKTYSVGLGRLDSSKTSGLLTPLGKYALGDRIAIYKNHSTGVHHGKKIEMITVFGTRWIPFDRELGPCTEPAKGFGIHGTPWATENLGQWNDNQSSIGKYESDGCIRLATPDMEELFAIVITKPTVIEIVPDFFQATFSIPEE